MRLPPIYLDSPLQTLTSTDIDHHQMNIIPGSLNIALVMAAGLLTARRTLYTRDKEIAARRPRLAIRNRTRTRGRCESKAGTHCSSGQAEKETSKSGGVRSPPRLSRPPCLALLAAQEPIVSFQAAFCPVWLGGCSRFPTSFNGPIPDTSDMLSTGLPADGPQGFSLVLRSSCKWLMA